MCQLHFRPLKLTSLRWRFIEESVICCCHGLSSYFLISKAAESKTKVVYKEPLFAGGVDTHKLEPTGMCHRPGYTFHPQNP